MITPRTIVPTSLRKSGQLWTRLGLGASTCRAMGACCQGGASESTASCRMVGVLLVEQLVSRKVACGGWDERFLLSSADLARGHPGPRGGAGGWAGNELRPEKAASTSFFG